MLKSLRRLLSARQVMAGKSIEEIKEEGLKELAANPSAYKVLDKQPTSSLENISGTPVPTPASIPVSTSPIGSNPTMTVGQTDPKRPAQQAGGASVQRAQVQKSAQKIASAAQTKTSAPGNSPAQRVNQQNTLAQSHSPAPSHVRSPAISHAPAPQKQKPASTLDDFKIGFPSKGLRRASTRWWGSLEKELATTSNLPEDKDIDIECPESLILGSENLSEGGFPTASSLLVRTRKKASLRGRSSIAHAVTRGYGIHKLGAKDAATLKFVFGDSLPKHWKAAFSDVS